MKMPTKFLVSSLTNQLTNGALKELQYKKLTKIPLIAFHHIYQNSQLELKASKFAKIANMSKS